MLQIHKNRVNDFDQVKNPNEKVQILTKTEKWGSIILIKLKTQITQMKKVEIFIKIHKNGVNDFDQH